MPRAAKRSTVNGYTGPSEAELVELQSTLAATLSSVSVRAFPADEWSALAASCIQQGYTLVVSPQMDGRAVRLSIPIGTRRLQLTAGNDQELLEAIRGMQLALSQLPANR